MEVTTTVKYAIRYALLCLCVCTANISGQEHALETKAFHEGKWVTFSTKDHPKAHGLKISMKYPDGWLPQEGQQPHVVKNFRRPGQLTGAVLIVRDLGATPSETDIATALSSEEIKKLIPQNCEVLEQESTKVDGLPACLTLYLVDQKFEKGDLTVATINWTFFYKSYMINLIGSAGVLSGNDDKLVQEMKEMLPVFRLMANSIIVERQ